MALDAVVGEDAVGTLAGDDGGSGPKADKTTPGSYKCDRCRWRRSAVWSRSAREISGPEDGRSTADNSLGTGIAAGADVLHVAVVAPLCSALPILSFRPARPMSQV